MKLSDKLRAGFARDAVYQEQTYKIRYAAL